MSQSHTPCDHNAVTNGHISENPSPLAQPHPLVTEPFLSNLFFPPWLPLPKPGCLLLTGWEWDHFTATRAGGGGQGCAEGGCGPREKPGRWVSSSPKPRPIQWCRQSQVPLMDKPWGRKGPHQWSWLRPWQGLAVPDSRAQGYGLFSPLCPMLLS